LKIESDKPQSALSYREERQGFFFAFSAVNKFPIRRIFAVNNISINKGILQQEEAGGRSAGYRLMQ
jgi:hypothetical protein